MCLCVYGPTGMSWTLYRDTQPFLPGLLMEAVRLPDNLAKETLHNKHKQRQDDPGNNRERANTKKHTNTDDYTHVDVQTKEKVIMMHEG